MIPIDGDRFLSAGPDGVVLPAYDGGCFTNLPGSIGDVLDVSLGRSIAGEPFSTDGIDTVVCVLLDGIGRKRFRRDGDAVSLLRRLSAAGRTTTLTAPFPSETAAAVASFHTGRPPAAHGVLGGVLWSADAARVLRAFQFAAPGAEPESATRDGLDATALNDGDTIHQRLGEAGIESHCIQPTPTVSGIYTDTFLAGAIRHGYDTPAEAGRLLADTVRSSDGPSFVYCYLPHVDVSSHRYGPDDDRYRTAMGEACAGVEAGIDRLVRRDETNPERTLVLLVADHGHVPSDPEQFVRFDEDPVLVDALAQGAGPAVMTGGPRSVYFHVPDDRVVPVRRRLTERYDGHVFTRTEAMDELALFGPSPTSRARTRCGDLVYVPRSHGAGGAVLESEKRSFHGGLTEREMLVPLCAARLSEIE